MQIYLKLRTVCSSRDHVKVETRGFTLTELLVSISIIMIVTSIVLTKYSAFDSTVLLKSEAYEIALDLREAQIRSVSVLRNDDSFDYPYGMSFTPGTNEYYSFRFKGSNNAIPDYDDPDSEHISTSTMQRSIKIQDVCVVVGGNPDCNIDRIDISFRRPEYHALYHLEGSPILSSEIESAKIKVDSPNGDTVFVVTISKLGQITVAVE